jgi:hypothetical protein
MTAPRKPKSSANFEASFLAPFYSFHIFHVPHDAHSREVSSDLHSSRLLWFYGPEDLAYGEVLTYLNPLPPARFFST